MHLLMPLLLSAAFSELASTACWRAATRSSS